MSFGALIFTKKQIFQFVRFLPGDPNPKRHNHNHPNLLLLPPKLLKLTSPSKQPFLTRTKSEHERVGAKFRRRRRRRLLSMEEQQDKREQDYYVDPSIDRDLSPSENDDYDGELFDLEPVSEVSDQELLRRGFPVPTPEPPEEPDEHYGPRGHSDPEDYSDSSGGGTGGGYFGSGFIHFTSRKTKRGHA